MLSSNFMSLLNKKNSNDCISCCFLFSYFKRNKIYVSAINLERGGFLKVQWKKLIICIALPLAAGALAAAFTGGNMQTFESINKPALSPPGWLFPVVWTVLYTLMGIASYFVLISEEPKAAALATYGLQLFFNFMWSIIFFNLEMYLFAFAWLVILWVLIFVTAIQFYGISKPAGYLMIPYLLWVTFAGYLNYMIYLLN